MEEWEMRLEKVIHVARTCRVWLAYVMTDFLSLSLSVSREVPCDLTHVLNELLCCFFRMDCWGATMEIGIVIKKLFQ